MLALTAFVIVALFDYVAVTSSLMPTIFNVMTSMNSELLCAFDEPSETLSAAAMQAKDGCVPLSALCAWSCTKDVSCAYFNFHEDSGVCEHFNGKPYKVSTKVGCRLYEVIMKVYNNNRSG
jgi:hypothetical protein